MEIPTRAILDDIEFDIIGKPIDEVIGALRKLQEKYHRKGYTDLVLTLERRCRERFIAICGDVPTD